MKRILSIDEMLAICDEIRSLSKAGVPLERGLVSAAKDLPKRLSNAADAIGNRGSQGIAVESIVNEDVGLPSIFKSVIKAGRRSGNLASALEGLYESGKRAIEMRRKIIIALFYPMLVLMLVTIASVFMFSRLPDVMADTLREQQIQPSETLLGLLQLVKFFTSWIWVPTLILSILVCIWIYQTKSAMLAQSTWFASITRWVPWVGRMLRLGRLAIFTDLLAMFVRQQVPLHEGLELSAEVTGDSELRAEAALLSQRIQQGQPLMMKDRELKTIPRLLQWQLDLNMQADDLADALSSEAKGYQEEAEDLAEWCNIQLPILFTVGIAGTATVAYALCVFLPWFTLMEEFAQPV